MTARLADLRTRLQQLEALQRSGELGGPAYAEARESLEREIVARVMAGATEDAAPPRAGAAAPAIGSGSGDGGVPDARPSRRLVAGVALVVLAIAATGYGLTGAPGLARLQAFGGTGDAPAGPASGDPQQVTRPQIEAMVEKLALRMKDRPDDAQGWLMLARAYSVLGRADDALPAYARAASLRPEDATTLADYADAIALHNGGRADAQAEALIAKALALEPANPKALAMSGTAAFDRADYAGAVREWQKMAQALPPGDPERPRVEASIAEARQRGGLTAGPVVAAMPDASAPGRGAPTLAAGQEAISGTVTLSPLLAGRASPDDTVFIFARAAQGPRMPLAVQRAKVRDLPVRFMLDDSMAMAPTAKLSGAPQVIVGARISKSGNAMPQAGDLAGESATVAPGTRDLAITIGSAIGP